MPTVNVVDTSGKPSGTLELKPDVFDVSIRIPLLHQAVTRELADRRVGTHDTKGRSEVSGGGKKPWRQKGTGRARQGSTRAAQWVGGATVFGPLPRDYSYRLPAEARRRALCVALSAKKREERLLIIDRIEVASGK